MRHFISVGTVKTPALLKVDTTPSHFASTSFTVNWLTVSSKFSWRDICFNFSKFYSFVMITTWVILRSFSAFSSKVSGLLSSSCRKPNWS